MKFYLAYNMYSTFVSTCSNHSSIRIFLFLFFYSKFSRTNREHKSDTEFYSLTASFVYCGYNNYSAFNANNDSIIYSYIITSKSPNYNTYSEIRPYYSMCVLTALPSYSGIKRRTTSDCLFMTCLPLWRQKSQHKIKLIN